MIARPFARCCSLVSLVSLALAACTADPPPGPGSPGAQPPTEFTARDAAELFAWPRVPVFDFALPPDRWAHLEANARAEVFEPAAVRFEGKDLGTAGLRFKGNYGTLLGCFD